MLYASCLALHTVTDLSIVALILIGGFVGTVYTVMVSHFDAATFSITTLKVTLSIVSHSNIVT
jgi:hypothetical protein